MKMHKLISCLLAVVLLLCLMPASAMAAEEEQQAVQSNGLVLDKTAVLADDGTYTINLEAYATGKISTTMERKPTDIIIVMDVSGSMIDPDWPTDNEASWQMYEGWWSTALQLQNNGEQFYCNKHTDQYETAELVKVSNYYDNGTYYDLYGYYCSRCGYSSAINRYYGVKISRYYLATAGLNDCYLESHTDLYRRTSSITRMEAMQQAVNDFINTTAAENVGYAESEQHRIALVKFAGLMFNNRMYGNEFYKESDGSYYVDDTYSSEYHTNCSQIIYDINYANSSNLSDMKAEVNKLYPAGATYAHNGLALAIEVLEGIKDPDREQIVLFFTDGEPTTETAFDSDIADSAIYNSNILINHYGAKVYTINMMPDSAITTKMVNYMNYLSSNYPDATSMTNYGTMRGAGYYKQVHAMDELNAIFDEISQTVSGSITELSGTAQLRDLMADGFVFTDNTKVVVQTVPYSGNNAWKSGETVQVYPAEDAYANSGILLDVDTTNNTVSVSGFSYKDNYVQDSYMNGSTVVPAQGKKLVVTITGVEATDQAIQNKYVPTNKDTSGIYPDNAEESPAVATFDVPEVLLTSKAYVMDFGRPVSLNPEDWQQGNISHLDDTGMHYFSNAITSRDMAYGLFGGMTASELKYYPQTLQWGGYDSVYVFGKDKNNASTNIWSKVSVLPANNVYYEDDFVAGSLNVESGIVYTNGQKPEDMSQDAWEAMQSAWNTTGGSDGSEEYENGPVHGWVEDLSDDQGHSDGSAHVVQAIVGQINDQLPSARFTFTGTGMDIYSFTDSNTGTILVTVAKQGGNTSYYVVDNYAASGSYYHIPTVTFSGEHGTYDVTIYVTTAASSEDRFTFYLDGIRVYNPLGENFYKDQIVQDAYAGEMNAVFEEVRNMLSSGAVFIDKDADGNTSVTMNYNDSDYAKYAPEHEVYLAAGQSVTFEVADDSHNYYVGLKALSGAATKAEFSFGVNNEQEIKAEQEISHTTDLYYKVIPNGKVITIKNAGTGILSITKVRQTTVAASDIGTFSLVPINEEQAMIYAAAFDQMPVVAYSAESAVPDVEVDDPVVNPGLEQLREMIKKLFAMLLGWF